MNSTFAENGSTSSPTIIGSHSVAVAMVATSVNIILGLPPNAYVIWLILAGATGTSNFFSLNLAMSEIMFSISSIFYVLYIKLEMFSCFEVFMFALGLLYTARPFFQCCICVECYIGVVHPVVFLQYKPLRYRVACGCVVWLVTLVSCVYSIYTYTNTMYLYGFFTQNLLFFSVMLYCCLSVLWALKRPGPGEKDRERKKSIAMKRQAFKVISLIVIFMTINFFLYVAAIPLQCCLAPILFTSALTICCSLALITGFIQPLLYLHGAGKLTCF